MAPIQEVVAAQERAEQALLNAEATAVYLNMSEEWVRKAAREGRLPSVKVGASLKFSRASLDSWIAQHERPPKRRTPRRTARAGR
jgi:excisionase family DNA binding protein